MREWKDTELGLIPEDWEIQNSSQYCLRVTDGTHDSPKSQDSGYPLITSKHIKGTTIDFSEAYLISEYDYYKINERSKVEQYDVIISMIGEYCGFVYLEDNENIEYAVKNVGLFKNKNLLDAQWLFYYLISTIGKYQLKLRRGGTSQPYLSLQVLRNLPILVPRNQEEKKSAASLLSCIDRKIENLRRQNETLEAIAQTLFKHWFIDFEFPDADGKPYKSSGGGMWRSAIGDIPEGWQVINLKHLMTLNYGKTLISETRINGQYPVVGSNGIIGTHNDFFVNAPGIVIGRKGTIGKVIWIEENFYPIDTTFYIEDNLGCNGLYFHYFILKNQKLNRLTSDSAVPGLNRDMAYSVEFAIPNIDQINKYNLTAKTLFNKINNNTNQIETLTKTRDALLPKLISGQLRIEE